MQALEIRGRSSKKGANLCLMFQSKADAVEALGRARKRYPLSAWKVQARTVRVDKGYFEVFCLTRRPKPTPNAQETDNA